MATRDEVIQGGRQLDDLLKTLPVKLQRNVSRAALRAGAVVLREEIRRNAPVDSGDLRRSVRVTSRARGDNVSASAKVGNRVAWYAHLVEFGTRPHVIKAPPGKGLNVAGQPRKEVNHPGIVGKPFIRPALDTKFPEVVRAVAAKYRERLTNQGLNTPAPTPVDPAE